jgi:hypothetical protein
MLTKYDSRRRVRPDHLTVISYRQCPPNYILKETIKDWFVDRLPEPQMISVYDVGINEWPPAKQKTITAVALAAPLTNYVNQAHQA